jgi:hypothetical protein
MVRDSFEGTLASTDREVRHPHWCRIPNREAQVDPGHRHRFALIHDPCAEPEQSAAAPPRAGQVMVQEPFRLTKRK